MTHQTTNGYETNIFGGYKPLRCYSYVGLNNLGAMGIKTKKVYLETVHTKENDVVLVPQFAGSIVETYCQGYWVNNKKIRMPKFDGYYYNNELTKVI